MIRIRRSEELKCKAEAALKKLSHSGNSGPPVALVAFKFKFDLLHQTCFLSLPSTCDSLLLSYKSCLEQNDHIERYCKLKISRLVRETPCFVYSPQTRRVSENKSHIYVYQPHLEPAGASSSLHEGSTSSHLGLQTALAGKPRLWSV